MELNLDEMEDRLASELLNFRERIAAVVDTLSDADVNKLIEECRRWSRPATNADFERPEWAGIAGIIETEYRARVAIRTADDFMRRTGHTAYCFQCRGVCSPEHSAILDAELSNARGP